MALKFTHSYIEDSLALFHHYKSLAEQAMAQISDEQLVTRSGGGDMNSIATIVKHLAGNMRSRWTDFLTSDGEKPDRNRDSEFVDPPATREALLGLWNDSWRILLTELQALSDDDLKRSVTIRGEAHSVMQAINRQIGHLAYHVGQIVVLARLFKSEDWEWLSVPPGQSEQYNRRVLAGEASQR